MRGVSTVHLVDDDPAFLTAMSRFLRAADFEVLPCDSARSLLAQVSAQTRGCIVADLDMPAVNGLDLQDQLAGRGVAMPVLFLTGHGDIPSSVRAMRQGAVDFLEKVASQEQLLAAIARALARDAQTHAERVKLEERRQRFACLTEREREVLALVVQGKINKQIAAMLGIHERTVKLHRTAITGKLGVRAAAQLAILVSEAHLFQTQAAPQSL
jgi:FixJ family two-component response regulator